MVVSAAPPGERPCRNPPPEAIGGGGAAASTANSSVWAKFPRPLGLAWGKRQRTRTGRGPDAGRTIEFEETDADRTRTGRGPDACVAVSPRGEGSEYSCRVLTA
eukprot:gene15707-biopygen21732